MKKTASLLLTALLFVALSGSAFAWSPELEGRPDSFHPGDSRGYFIWHDEHGLHLRTAARLHGHQFSGVLRTDGHFFDVRGTWLEADDSYSLGHEEHRVTFHFDTGSGGVDGIDFRVRGGDKVVFDLYMDGHKVATDEINGGSNNWHPDSHRFEIFR